MGKVKGWMIRVGVVMIGIFSSLEKASSCEQDTFESHVREKGYPSVLTTAFKAYQEGELARLHTFLKEVPEVEKEMLSR